MKVNEIGVLEQSEYFHFVPPEQFNQFYPYIINCGHFFCNENYKVNRSGNHSPLLLYVINGSLHLTYEKQSYDILSSELLLIDGNLPHSYACSNHCEFIYAHFMGGYSTTLVQSLINQNHSPVFKLSNHYDIYQKLQLLINRIHQRHSISDIDLTTSIYECLCLIQLLQTSPNSLHSSHDHIISKSIQFMKDHIHESISLQQIADDVNLSVYYYARLFKEMTGQTPMEYFSSLKINLSKVMLMTTEMTINEISNSLDYSSSASFINAFRSRVGVSPSQFRHKQESI